MDILIVTLFFSLVLAGAGIGFFVWSVNQGTYEHHARLALLPIEDDDEPIEDDDEQPLEEET